MENQQNINQENNTRKNFIQALPLIKISFLIVAVIIIGYGVWQYDKISKAIANAEQLILEQNYENAITELESVQNNWTVKYLSFKKQEINQKIEENKQLLQYQTSYNEGIGNIKGGDWEKAKELLSAIPENSLYYSEAKDKTEILNEILDCQYRKGEYRMKVTDSEGRVTGMVDGKIREEIPFSMFNEENNMVNVFSPGDNYIYEFYATKGGNYQFTHNSFKGREVMEFYLENIPILTGATHRIQAEEKGLLVKYMTGVVMIDNESDGDFEEEISFDQKLTCEEFLVRTKMPEITKI
ncbi:MAG: hypothetical protein ABH889_00685 [Candidatus Portnoybacteria bacterium]